MASHINETYGETPLTIVGVMTGSVMLMADLIRLLNMPMHVGIVLASIAVTLVLLGTIREPVTLMIVIIPGFLPVAQSVGIDMVQMGVVVVLATLIGLVTPPVGDHSR